ncbi:Acetyltransferase (GNAT) family protein [Pedobacter steynii]|uniref:Acetyltransferase (GNAT) family protein n=1 Tax=Pedobacter steynii TaxID=430522 RepID=A0A1H0G7F1_9SPHI|nr:GNAT family N-acetyltransferase [Pedobacter steynii]NQX42345.1 GNAT family N-acetyltransferase [Pedobacter steynii]SDO02796.1 Acetyltransferase (GNAT) family protein [Pedobacter steynii]
MKRATYSDRKEVIRILSGSFSENKSVSYLVGSRAGRNQRIDRLMEYAFDECMDFGVVYISEDMKACALVLYPEKKKTTCKSILRNVKLVLSVVGLFNVLKILKKESIVAKAQRAERLKYYVWFVAVDISFQSQGIGSHLMSELIKDSVEMKRQLILETSTERNLPFYVANGLSVYTDEDVGYRLYFLKY